MGEAIVSTIVEKLKDLVIDKASEAWKLVRGVEEEVKRLKSNFEALQLVLEDAEEKQYLDKFLKHWLDRFKDASYDMEDVLDDWQTAVLQSPALQTEEIESGTSGFAPWLKVCRPLFSCFSYGSQVVMRHDIATRIKEINEEVEKIVQDKARFELVKKETKQPKWSETTAFGDVSELIGRDKVKGEIIRTLQCGTSEGEEGNRNIPTISIVGMGGIGKSSLAQLIYHDNKIQTHFNKMIIWVSVGNPFDQTQIARAILQSLDPCSPICQQNQPPLQNLLSEIREKITGKKFFLVLDDVWTDRSQDWKQLKATLKYGMCGSWILVTTRKESVAKQMDSSHVIPLKELDDELCWSIIAQNAFAGRNKDSHEHLKDIGRKLAKKCNGLPLAAKALGGLLKDKTRREEWENVLNSEIWRPDFEKEIFSPLLLSYYDLPSPIRQCLSYCAIFPKNHNFHQDELIQHWMAQRYLDNDNILQGQWKGEDYFKYLATRFFFQDFEKDGEGNLISFKMHDLVHDFIKFLTKEGFVAKRVGKDLSLDLSSKRIRHLRLRVGRRSSLPMFLNGTEKLRSLVVAVSYGSKKSTSDALHILFSQSKHLRLLKFDSLNLDEDEMPHDFGNLIHLRYLSIISCSNIENLLEAVCELSNLQSLNLQDCSSLEKLPDKIGKLINLRYLCTEGCSALSYYPKGISNLTSLIRLNNITVKTDCNDAGEFSIGDLEKLDLLGGNLMVKVIGYGIDWDEAKRAKLCNKIHLKCLHICICSPHIKEEELLQALNPPSSLPVRLTDYQTWVERVESSRIREKIRISARVQKAALQFIDGAVSSVSKRANSCRR
ncbi:disease resistance protein RGA3 [Canna indica]|uniref:Disease resistance protein RGA3 n=1 Tax=Canna indica TaxID=4628 RepID=A0AAQ3K0H9_9LILI|nr:disease resistance protein RGA3 [Canna indica]